MRESLRLRRVLPLVCVSLIALGSQPRAAGPGVSEDFPEPAGLSSAVAFWMRVYLEVTTRQGLLHDSRELGVVYETIRFDGRKTRRAQERWVEQRKQHWRGVLRRMAKGDPARNQQEQAVLRLFEFELGRPPKPRDLHAASRRIRFQLGQRDKFREGIIRSGAYEDEMRAVMRRYGLPEDLAYLPHVESSFNIEAYSKYGAAGLWQFMRSTGRRYMTISYVIDERVDPSIATVAAAKLLKQNYRSLKSWPLAITAYNHGAAGMRRAKRKLGTDDIAVIAEKYRSRTFGFASRNFYAQFLAARRVLRAYEPYFGPLQRDTPEPVDELELPFYADVRDLHSYLGLSPNVVRRYNPSLRRPVFNAGKRIPKGFVLRLPAGTVHPSPELWLTALPEDKRHAEQHHSRYYQVRRGDSLSRIAKRNRTSVGTLVALNNLPSRHRIYPGQVLQLPDRGSSRPPAPSIALVKSAHAAPAPPAPTPEPAPAQPAPPAPTPAPLHAASTHSPGAAPPGLGPAARAVGVAPPSVGEDSPWRRVDSDRVIVDADETLGHFADWLGVSAQRLRNLNGIPYGRHLRIGQRLRLDFSRKDPATFLERRMEYHKGIEEDFFATYRVTGTVEHELRRGDSLWQLSHKAYRVPAWLIHRYNPTADLNSLTPGDTLMIPVIEAL